MQVIGKVSSRVEIRIYVSSKRVTGLSSLRKHTPHGIAQKSLQVRRRSKLGEDMAAGIRDARESRGDPQTRIGSEEVEHAWMRNGNLRRRLREDGSLRQIWDVRKDAFDVVA